MRIRAWRRGTKELDLILGSYVNHFVHKFTEGELALMEALLDEEEDDIYSWVSGRIEGPKKYQITLGRIKEQNYKFS
jgi:antitoxin CptB